MTIFDTSGVGAPRKDPSLSLSTLDSRFRLDLKRLYDAEHRVVRAMWRLADLASAPELRMAFRRRMEESQEHIARLESVFDEIDEAPKRERAAGMKGLIDDADALLSEPLTPGVREVATIAAARRMVHYGVAAYGILLCWARLLQYGESGLLLKAMHEEEKVAEQAQGELARGVTLRYFAAPDPVENRL